MHIRSVQPGFVTNNAGEPELLGVSRIQSQRIALSIYLGSNTFSGGDKRYGEWNSSLPFGSVLISKSAILSFCKFAYVGLPKPPWSSLKMS